MRRHLSAVLTILTLVSLVAADGAADAGAQMRLYLASPLGFSEAGRDFKDLSLKPKLTQIGFEVVDPWTLTDAKTIESVLKLPYGQRKLEAWKKLNPQIGKTNQKAIDRVDIVVAVLDGTDVDSGTAAEIGYAFAKGKIIIGYRGDFRLASDNEGSAVNLQVEYFIRQSGGNIVSNLSQLTAALVRLKERSARHRTGNVY